MATGAVYRPNRETGFFEGARSGHLAFPFCRTCKTFHWYPMPRCPSCRGREIEWRRIAGRGEVYSFTRVEHPFDKSRIGSLPYVVALVTFPDASGVRLVTNIVGAAPGALRVGLPVEPVFRTDDSGRTVVEFRLA